MGDLALRKAEAFRGKQDAFKLDPRLLKVDPDYNIRDLSTPEAREKLDYLKGLIREHGVRSPLVVRMNGNNCYIVEGHRRHKVVMELIAESKAYRERFGTLLCIQEPSGTTPLDRMYGLKYSNSGEPITPLEFANLIYRALNVFGQTEEQAAQGFGVSVEVLRYSLSHRSLAEPVKEMVRNGEVSVTLARDVTEKHGDRAAQVLTDAKASAKPDRKGKIKVRPRHVAPEPKEDPEPDRIPVHATSPAPERPGPEDIEPATRTPVHPVPEGALPATWTEATAGAWRGSTSGKLIPIHQVSDLVESALPIFDAIRLSDLAEYGDDDTVTIQVSARQAKAFDAQVAKITGGMEP